MSVRIYFISKTLKLKCQHAKFLWKRLKPDILIKNPSYVKHCPAIVTILKLRSTIKSCISLSQFFMSNIVERQIHDLIVDLNFKMVTIAWQCLT
jgi:hypothetical protein